MRISVLTLMAVALLLGCGKEPEGGAVKRGRESEQSVAGQIIDDFTGKTAADAGRRAKSTIDSATARRQKDMDEVFGE